MSFLEIRLEWCLKGVGGARTRQSRTLWHTISFHIRASSDTWHTVDISSRGEGGVVRECLSNVVVCAVYIFIFLAMCQQLLRDGKGEDSLHS